MAVRFLASTLRCLPSARSCSTASAAASVAPAGYTPGPSRLEAMLQHNRRFVQSGEYLNFAVSVPAPATRCVILTCMDSRLTHLLPAALNIKQGEAKVIKTAGAMVSHAFGGAMRSILVAVYELQATEVFVVGHLDCGMSSLDPEATKRKMVAAGVPADRLGVLEASGINVSQWLKGFASVDASVLSTVSNIRRHPLLPPNLRVTGLVINSTTGELKLPIPPKDSAAPTHLL